MDALSLPLSNRLLVLSAPHAAVRWMLELAARLALSGPLRVLDGGNRFNVYPVARTIRRYSAELTAALARIELVRAFTCYQLAAMLQEMPADGRPLLVLDMLATFYDESVNWMKAAAAFGCIPHCSASARPPAGGQRQTPVPLSPAHGAAGYAPAAARRLAA